MGDTAGGEVLLHDTAISIVGLFDFSRKRCCVSLRLAITWTFSSMSRWHTERVHMAQSLPSRHTEDLFLHARIYTCVSVCVCGCVREIISNYAILLLFFLFPINSAHLFTTQLCFTGTAAVYRVVNQP